MALEILVYDLDAESRKLPTGCVYARTGAAWVVEAGRMRQLAANEPMWGPRGLIVEDAATNLLALSQPSSGAEWSQAGLYDFPQAVSMLAGGTALAHAAKGTSDSPVREITDPLSSVGVALATVWALVECLDNVYVDIGTRDSAQNWVDRARWAQPYGLAYPLPSDRVDMAALGRLRSEIGPNRGRLIEIACASPSGLDNRKLGVAPTGDHQSHLRAVLHHVQLEAGPGPTSPIVTTAGAGTRDRATAIAAVLSVGAQQTSLQILGQAPVWMGKRQVIWQMDADTDADGQRVALERTAAGQLQLVCGGVLLDLGKLANGESFGVGLQVSGGTMRASRDGLPVVSVAASLPAATKERWGHGYAAGAAFSGETIRQRRWLSVATDEELRALSVDALALPGDQSTLTTPALYAAAFAKARPPATLLENAVVPSSGAAELRLCYAGAGTPPKKVWRAGRSASSKQELPWYGGRRVENKWTGATWGGTNGGDGTAPTITTGRPDAFGGSTAVRIQGARSTQDSTNFSGAQIGFAAGSLVPDGPGTVLVSYFVRSANGTPHSVHFTGGGAVTGRAISVDGSWRRVSPGPVAVAAAALLYLQILAFSASASLAIDVDVCGIQVEDMTGCDQTAPSEYVDPAMTYNGGCPGVRWFEATCGNTLDGSWRVVEAPGVALSEPMGMMWQPATSSKGRALAPNSATVVTIADAPSAVGGLRSKRITANAPGQIQVAKGSATTAASCLASGTFKPGPTAGFGIGVLGSGKWAFAYFSNSGAYVAKSEGGGGTISVLQNIGIGNGSFYVNVSCAGITGGGNLILFPLVSGGTDYVADMAGRYVDVAAWCSCDGIGFQGTPFIPADAADVARVANNPLTGLPPVGASPLTVMVHATILHTALTPIFSAKAEYENGSGQCSIYFNNGSLYAFYDPNAFTVSLPAIGTPFKIIARFDGSKFSMFFNGAQSGQAATSPINFTAPPQFGPRVGYGFGPGPLLMHENRLIYAALSDAECIAMTTL
jgi:hypothetical protein